MSGSPPPPRGIDVVQNGRPTVDGCRPLECSIPSIPEFWYLGIASLSMWVEEMMVGPRRSIAKYFHDEPDSSE
jgi:hypothetical protein